MATAEQTVSAVLDATNKRYVVETYKTEDGLGGYTVYSDGLCEQWGAKILDGQSVGPLIVVTLPKSYSNKNFHVLVSVVANRSEYWIWAPQAKPIDNSSFQMFIGGNAGEGISWSVKGYVA